VFLGLFAARGLDEDAPHRFGRGREEVPTMIELLIADEPQECFVDQRGRFECVAGLFVRELGGRELAQLVVDERQELRGPGRASANVIEYTSDVGHEREDKRWSEGEQQSRACR